MDNSVFYMAEWLSHVDHGSYPSCRLCEFEPRGQLLISFFFLRWHDTNIKISSDLCLNTPAYVSENL